jgi:hypothetical protein
MVCLSSREPQLSHEWPGNESANDRPDLARAGGEEHQQLYVFKDVGQKLTQGVMIVQLNRRGHIS